MGNMTTTRRIMASLVGAMCASAPPAEGFTPPGCLGERSSTVRAPKEGKKTALQFLVLDHLGSHFSGPGSVCIVKLAVPDALWVSVCSILEPTSAACSTMWR